MNNFRSNVRKIMIARLDLPGASAKSQGSQQPAIGAANPIPHLRAAQGAVSQIMVPLDEFVPPIRLIRHLAGFAGHVR